MLHLMNTTSFQKNHQNTQLIEWGASSSCINQLHLGQLISWHLINRYCYLPTYLLLVVLTQEKGSHQGYRYVYFAKSTAIIRFDVYCGFQKTGIYTSILCLFTKQVSMWNVYQIVDESIEQVSYKYPQGLVYIISPFVLAHFLYIYFIYQVSINTQFDSCLVQYIFGEPVCNLRSTFLMMLSFDLEKLLCESSFNQDQLF